MVMLKVKRVSILMMVMLLFTCLSNGVTGIVTADEIMHVKINGAAVNFDDQTPVVENNRTLVPMRIIFEKLGATIQWDEATQTVEAEKDSTSIVLQIGNMVAKKNGADMSLDVPPYVVNGRTMVPLRFVGEALGAEVKWVEETNTVEITMPTAISKETPTPTPKATPTTTPKATPAPAQAVDESIKPGFSYGGTWAASSLKGANPNLKTYYIRDKFAYAIWNPDIKEECSVKAYIYKVVHESSGKQNYVINHNGKADKATVDFKSGTSEWTEIGTYDFSGKGNEYVKLLCNISTSTRVAEAKFEITSGPNKGKVITVEQKFSQ